MLGLQLWHLSLERGDISLIPFFPEFSSDTQIWEAWREEGPKKIWEGLKAWEPVQKFHIKGGYRKNSERLGCTAPKSCLVLLFSSTLPGRVEEAKTNCTTNLEASLGKEAGCEEGKIALPSEIPVAAPLLIKHQKEHACFFPSVALQSPALQSVAELLSSWTSSYKTGWRAVYLLSAQCLQ